MDNKGEVCSAKLWRDKNFHILNIVSFVSIMSNVLNPAFRAIAEAFHITPDQVGFLTTAYGLPMVILSPVVGIIADRLGRKKVMGISVLIFGLSALLSANAKSYGVLLLSEFVRGIGQPGMVIVAIVLIGDFYTGKTQDRVMGINTAVMNFGLALLPIIGGFLAGFGWNYPYMVLLLAVPAGIMALFGLKEPEMVKEQEKILPYVKAALSYYKNGRVIVISFLSFFVYALLSGCYLVYTAFLLEDPSYIGLVFASMSIASCLPSIFIEKLIGAVGKETLMKVAFVCFICAFILGANAHSLPAAFLFSAVFGLGIGIVMPVQMIMLLPLSPDHVRGAFIAIQNLIHRLGQTLGPVIFGLIFMKFEITGVFYSAAIISTVALLIALLWLKKTPGRD